MSWTTKRVELLTNLWKSGVTADGIAKELGGITRNAVIGKVHRLGLEGRPKRSAPRRPRAARSSHERLNFRKNMALAKFEPQPEEVIEVVVDSTNRCTLLELVEGKCRWPNGDPAGSMSGSSDFSFCGNESAAGLSYCAGHARIAYRAPERQRRRYAA